MGVLVGKPAPDFTCAAVLANGEIVDEYTRSKAMKGKYGLVFFYPLDFTFVCPSELIALDHRMDKFNELGVEVVGVSIDSHFTHNAWRNTEGNVRSQTVNDLPLGRNIDELVRLVEALQFHEEHGEVCPAGWTKGDKGMVDSPEGVASYLAENASKL